MSSHTDLVTRVSISSSSRRSMSPLLCAHLKVTRVADPILGTMFTWVPPSKCSTTAIIISSNADPSWCPVSESCRAIKRFPAAARARAAQEDLEVITRALDTSQSSEIANALAWDQVARILIVEWVAERFFQIKWLWLLSLASNQLLSVLLLLFWLIQMNFKCNFVFEYFQVIRVAVLYCKSFPSKLCKLVYIF